MASAIGELGTPFSKAVGREIQTRNIQNDLGASSKSSGRKSKKPKVAPVSYKEDDYFEKKPVAKASAPAPKKAVAAKKKRRKKAAKKPKKVTPGPGAKKADHAKKVESDHSNSMSSDIDWDSDEFNSTNPYKPPRGTIHGPPYIPGVLCTICNGEHWTCYCPCSWSIDSLPPNVHLNEPFYKCCSRCGGEVDEFDYDEDFGFKCTLCLKRVRAYAALKTDRESPLDAWFKEPILPKKSKSGQTCVVEK